MNPGDPEPLEPARLFRAGKLVLTLGAQAALTPIEAFAYLTRHLHGDWGDVSDEDAHQNDRDVVQGGRLLSAYTIAPNLRIYIITEADRSATTIMLPDEY